MSGKLFIVATPIGNLKDISPRAIETLKSVDAILAEDTRITQKLLAKYDIKTKTISYHHHSPETKKIEILSRLQKGENLALVTDAGTPGIADPGNELMDFLYASTGAKYQQAERLAAPPGPSKEQGPDIEQQVTVTPIPGPSSLTAALSLCGFATSKFIFAGFFPKKKAKKWLQNYFTQSITTIYFDSPYRLIKNLEKLENQIGDRRILVARELTKLHEETFHGTVSEVLKLLRNTNPKGEVVVVVEA